MTLESGLQSEKSLQGARVSWGFSRRGVAAGRERPCDLLAYSRQIARVAVVTATKPCSPTGREEEVDDLWPTARAGVIVVRAGRRGPVVLAGSVDRGRVGEAEDVMATARGSKCWAAARQVSSCRAPSRPGRPPDLVLGERVTLGEEEPVT